MTDWLWRKNLEAVSRSRVLLRRAAPLEVASGFDRLSLCLEFTRDEFHTRFRRVANQKREQQLLQRSLDLFQLVDQQHRGRAIGPDVVNRLLDVPRAEQRDPPRGALARLPVCASN